MGPTWTVALPAQVGSFFLCIVSPMVAESTHNTAANDWFPCLFSSTLSVLSVQFPRVAQCQDNQQPIIFRRSTESQSVVRSGPE